VYFVILAGTIFCAFGLLHAIFTLMDWRHPRRLAPVDPNVVTQMVSTGLRLSRGRTNMWDAWIGFNLSHSLGAILFGTLCIATGIAMRSMTVPWPVFAALVLIAAIYEVLALRFWFRVPAIGIAIAGMSLIAGWLLGAAG
jgi:hypothetical protein